MQSHSFYPDLFVLIDIWIKRNKKKSNTKFQIVNNKECCDIFNDLMNKYVHGTLTSEEQIYVDQLRR